MGITHLHITPDDGSPEYIIRPYIPGETEKTMPSGRVVAHDDPCPYVTEAMRAYADS